MNRSFRRNLADADGEHPVEESVLRRGSLEPRQRSEVVVPVVAHAGERRMNESAIIGLESHTRIELEGSIGPNRDPVAAAEHPAAKAIAFERPTDDWKDRERAC